MRLAPPVLLGLALLSAAHAHAAAPARCLYVSSYHAGYEWNDGIERGLEAELRGRCELTRFYMDGKRDVVIDLCDEFAKPVIRWKVKKALPTKMDVPSFDANSNEIAIETMELIAAGLQVDYEPE